MTQFKYIAKRPFKVHGKFYPAGTPFPANVPEIRFFKIKLHEGAIVEIPADKRKLEILRDYFQVRLGMDLDEILAGKKEEAPASAEPEKPSASASPPQPGTSAQKPAAPAASAPTASNTPTK